MTDRTRTRRPKRQEQNHDAEPDRPASPPPTQVVWTASRSTDYVAWSSLVATPSLAQEGVCAAPVQATEEQDLQELSEPELRIACLAHPEARGLRRRRCPRMSVSPKMYASRTRERTVVT